MSESYYLSCDTILVDKGDYSKRFWRGDELVDVPGGTLESLIRLGRAISAEEMEALQAVIPAEEQGEASADGNDAVVAPPWLQFKVENLLLQESIVNALDKAGIDTVAKLMQYGVDHKGSLVSIKGIGAASEKEIRDAIVALKQQQ